MSKLPNIGLVLGLIEQRHHDGDKKRHISVIWSGSIWGSETETWNLFFSMLSNDVFNFDDYESNWLYTPIRWNEIEIYCLSRGFRATDHMIGYVVLFHQYDSVLTQFMIDNEEKITKAYTDIFRKAYLGKLSNEQLKQIRIVSQEYYVRLTQQPFPQIEEEE